MMNNALTISHRLKSAFIDNKRNFNSTKAVLAHIIFAMFYIKESPPLGRPSLVLFVLRNERVLL